MQQILEQLSQTLQETSETGAVAVEMKVKVKLLFFDPKKSRISRMVQVHRC